MEHLVKNMDYVIFNNHSAPIKHGWGNLYEKYKTNIDINGRILYSLISIEDRNEISLITMRKKDMDGVTKMFCSPSKMIMSTWS